MKLKKWLKHVERDRIINAIKLHAGNVTQAAEWLGVERTLLYRKIRKLGIDLEEARKPSDT